MIQELLTKGIGHTQFKESPVGRIPQGWEVKKLKDISVKIRDGNYGAEYPKQSEMLEIGIPFLTSSVIESSHVINFAKLKFISAEKHRRFTKAHIQLGDVLFTNRGANVGNVALVPKELHDANIGPQITFIRVDTRFINSQFLYYSFQTLCFKEQLRKMDSGSAMNFLAFLPPKHFFLLPYPSLNSKRH